MKYIKPIPAPQRTFFYERLDGSWFACEELEASLHEKRRSNKVRLVGTSDGKTYYQLMVKKALEITARANELDKKLESKRMSQSKYDKEIEKLNIELKQASMDFQLEEYKVAKGHIIKPVDPNLKRLGDLNSNQQQSVSRLIG